jgi:hypothetical protein
MDLRQWAIEAAIESGAKENMGLYYADQFIEYVLGVAEQKHDAP